MLAEITKANLYFKNVIKLTLMAGLSIVLSAHAYGQFGPSAVGGILVDSEGVLQNSPVRLNDDIMGQLSKSVKDADSKLNKPGLRVISLSQLEKKIVDCKNAGLPLPASVRYMAGLQRIEYVIVSPDSDDVLIAGPGEGFKVAEDGSVVGTKSGMPVIQLQDFLVAMRSVQNARTGNGITVSIDPSEEGVKNVQKMMQRMSPSSFNPDAARALERACGPQKITLTGVPKDSRYSQVLVAADYKMKRLAMGLEPAPEFLPSLLAIAQQKDKMIRKMSPRFWMETSYDPIAVSDDKKVWKLNGQGVCTKTIEDFHSSNGNKTSKPNKFAKKWADDMTERFEDLSAKQPVFRELRNLMDMSVVAAIIERERLLEKVSLDIPAIKGLDTISVSKFNVPEQVPTQCSFARLTRGVLVTTSGGVSVNSWAVAQNLTTDEGLGKVASSVLNGKSDRWWWNVN